MTIRTTTKNAFIKCTSIYLLILLFSLLFIDEQHLGIFGTLFMNIIAATIIYLFYFFQKHENVHVDNESIQLRSKEKIIKRIPIEKIQSFNAEDVYSNGATSDGAVLKKLYIIRAKNGETLSFSRSLYNENEVVQLLNLCQMQNNEIITNILSTTHD